MSGAVLGLAVGLCVLGAGSPWSAARVGARRLRGVGGALGGASADPRAGRLSVTDPPVEVGVLLELLGAAVRAGTSVPRALEAVGAAVGGTDGAALSRAGASVVLGSRWEDAWAGAPARLEVVRRALGPAWEQGAAPGDSLRVAGEQLRRDGQAVARQAAARLAVHLVLPLGACFLPAFVLIGLLPLLLSFGIDLLGA